MLDVRHGLVVMHHHILLSISDVRGDSSEMNSKYWTHTVQSDFQSEI